jgi:hypothetical protein
MKESLYPVQGSKVIFREAFRSQSDTEHINDATVTGVSFSNGLATFGAGNSIAYGPVVPGVKSVRIKGIFPNITTTLLTLSGSHSISVAAGTISATGFSSPTIYVDGSAGSTLTAGSHEIVVTTATAITANTLGIASFVGSLSLIDLFSITLSATEVSLLAQNKLYAGLVTQGLVAYYNFTRGSSYDYSHNGNDGTDSGMVYKHGLGAECKSGQYISLPTFQSTLRNDFTILGICDGTASGADQDMLGGYTATDYLRLTINSLGGLDFQFKAGNVGQLVRQTGVFSGVPVSFACQGIDQTVLKIFINGEQKQAPATTIDFSVYTSSVNLFIGALNIGGTPYNSLIAFIPMFTIYSRAISLAEITQNTQYFKQQGWI